MMRAAHAFILAAMATAAATGAAAAETRTFDLDPFEAIDIATGLDAVVTVGEPQTVRVEAGNSQVFDKLTVVVEGGKLSAYLDTDFFDFIMEGGLLGMLVNGRPDVTIHITVPALRDIAASSGADIVARGVTGENLELSASSGSDVSITGLAVGRIAGSASSGASLALAGTCEGFEIDASSGSSVDAEDLVCKSIDANASSGASIEVHASERARAEASSGGDVRIYGNPPDTDFDSSSGGDVELDT
mgnify:CR=1 FL=1